MSVMSPKVLVTGMFVMHDLKRAVIEDVDEWDVCNVHGDLLFRDIFNGIDDHNILISVIATMNLRLYDVHGVG